MTKLTSVNFDDPEAVRHRVNFDNLTPLYPDERLQPRYARSRRSRTSRRG